MSPLLWGTLKDPNNNIVGMQYRLLLVNTKRGEEGSTYIHTLITLLLVYTNTGEEGLLATNSTRTKVAH